VIASALDLRALALLVAAAFASACGGAAAVPRDAVFEAPQRRAAYLPDDTDRAARDVAAAALGSDRDAALAQLAAYEKTEEIRRAAGEPPTGLDGYVQHVVDATHDDAIAYREASSELLERRDLDPALRKQIEMEVADDPLLLAKQRIGEGRRARVARGVNTISAAVGRSIFTTLLAPARLAQAVVSLLVAEHLDDPISTQERQALGHWKQYVDAHPETPEARELVDRIERMNELWASTKRRNSVRVAEQSLERGQPELALLLAERALRYAPDDRRAKRIRDAAEEKIDERKAVRASSLAVTSGPLADAGDPRARDLSVALLARGDVIAASDAVLAESPGPPLEQAARFARANEEGEAGRESEMWEEIEEIASDDADAPAISREARVVIDSLYQNPWHGFETAKGNERKSRAAMVAFGPLAGGARDRDLPRSVEWLLEAPSLFPMVGGIPWRLFQIGISPPESKAPGVAAEIYLDRFPNGEHADELRRWLVAHEMGRKRFVRAYAIASEAPGFDPEELHELAEKAAEQTIAMADKQNRRDMKLALLQSAAERFPDTESGRLAAERFEAELERASEQRVRISRGFLVENPNVAGPDGLGLRRELLDGNDENGELHPQGVTLLGGREVEIALVAPGRDKDDDPEPMRQTISAERLSRLVSLLEETALRNALLDPLAEQRADAPRDYFFERARLGVADAVDLRPTASSSFAFVGVREKYNMVRSRESILPVEIVISGSLPDLGLGAFPRIRMPKETPDAVLYK